MKQQELFDIQGDPLFDFSYHPKAQPKSGKKTELTMNLPAKFCGQNLINGQNQFNMNFAEIPRKNLINIKNPPYRGRKKYTAEQAQQHIYMTYTYIDNCHETILSYSVDKPETPCGTVQWILSAFIQRIYNGALLTTIG